MKRIQTQFTPTFSGVRATYVGKPLEKIAATNKILDNRYKSNKQAYEDQLDFLDVTVEARNQQHVTNRKDAVKDGFADTINSNSFEFGEQVVSTQARDIKNDRYLKGSIQSKAAHNAYTENIDKMVEADDLDTNTSARLRSEAAAQNGKSIEVDENGTIKNVFSAARAVKDPKINDQVREMAKMLKGSKKPITLPDGRQIWSAGGAWRMTGHEEGIDNAKANSAMLALVLSEPKNQAWFTQQNRLEDNAEIVRNEDGTFATDKEGNYIRDLKQVNYRNKLETLYSKEGELDSLLTTYNNQNPNFVLNKNTMSESDYMQLYKGQRNKVDALKRVAAGVNLVDYNKRELKVHQDRLYIDAVKRQRDRAEELQALRNSPKVRMDLANRRGLAKTSGELWAKRSTYKTTYEAGLKDLQKMAESRGLQGTVKITPNGLVLMQNGKAVPLNGDIKQQLESSYRTNVKDAYTKYETSNNYINTFVKELPPADKAALQTEILSQLKSKGFSTIGKAMFQDMPDAVFDRAVKAGVIELPEGVTWKQYLANATAGAATVGGYGAAGGPIGIGAGAIMGGLMGLTGTAIAEGLGYQNVKLKNGKTDQDLFNFIMNDQQGQMAAANVVNDYFEDGNNPAMTARLDQSLASQINTTSNVVAKGVLISGGAVKGDKASSSAKYDREAAIFNGISSTHSMTDPEGATISENQSETTSGDLTTLLNSKDVKTVFLYEGTRPVMAYSGIIDVLDDEGNKIDTKKVEAFRDMTSEEAAYYAPRYLDNKEQQVELVNNAIFSHFDNINGNTTMQMDGDNAYDMWRNDDGQKLQTTTGRTGTVARVAYDKDGKPIDTDDYNTQVKSWGFKFTDDLHTDQYFYANSAVEMSQKYIQYVNCLNDPNCN